MRNLLIVLCCVCTQVFCYFPRSSLGNSEIIGNLQEGLMIPLADFTYMGAKTDKGSPCLRYKSRIFPEADFIFIHDLFDYPLRLEEYADWFTQADFAFFHHKERGFVNGGMDGTTPILMQRWENCDSYYFQLFLGRGREGFCCFVYLPKLAYQEELCYWEDFFDELPFLIQISR
ncbi:MAG: hypothetical protein K1000chlam3_00903 [Chlamydiae bacterium]|nr:hypothetical protein [Chlamydiota bacterium]